MWHEAFHVLADPGHMIAEVVMEVLFFILGMIGNWLMMKYRDRKHGHKE
jgi:hypothetical protein